MTQQFTINIRMVVQKMSHLLGVSLLLLELVMHMNAAGNEYLVERLESVSKAEIRTYQLKTTQGRRMDCLKVFQPLGSEYHGVYFGLYHRLENGVFNIRLATSTDLKTWQDIKTLDEHASQPTVYSGDDGRVLVAYEKDAPNSCWIRLRSYDDLTHLQEGTFSREFDIQRSLAPTAEGTPSFESVTMGQGGVGDSEIRLRFHYFKDVRVDQLAFGTLTDFNSWKSESSDKINEALIKNGWLGNLGDRDRFNWGEKTYYLQETQGKRSDWSSWRINLCDSQGMPIRTLQFQTDRQSTSFANPNATWVRNATHQRQLVVTLFLPSEGNHANEAGTLLYVLRP
jgi:hypothetical protein